MKLARNFGGVLALAALVAAAVLYGRPVAGFDIQNAPTLVARPGGAAHRNHHVRRTVTPESKSRPTAPVGVLMGGLRSAVVPG